jgi:hypothetical protein
MELIDDKEFEKSGGLTIGIGAKNCLYTLRSEYNEQAAFHQGDGQSPDIRMLRRSHHCRNLGKDWSEVAQNLPIVLEEAGYGKDAKVFVPGHCNGVLDPNKAPDPTFIPTEIIPFGRHQNRTIGEVMEENADYLYGFAA